MSSFVLNEADYNPSELNTSAVLTFEDGKILSIDLNLEGDIPKISQEKFVKLANEAKNDCPISGALTCKISVTPTLV